VERYEPQSYWGSLHSSGEDLRVVGYPTLPFAFNRVLYKNTAEAVRRAVQHAAVAVEGAAVLDIGSGTGFWIDFWSSEGAARVCGVDLVPEAVERLRVRFPANEFVESDISDGLPFPGKTFDIVSAMGVLLHVTDEARFSRALSNLAQQVAPGGALVFVEPLVVHGRWGPGAESAHNVVRTVADWKRALDGTGFQMTHIEPVTFILSDPVDGRTAVTFAFNSLWWRVFARILRGHERLATLVVPTLGTIDRALVRLSRTGPSAKCIVLRRD
jgi:SAM-dependent methyltransferase